MSVELQIINFPPLSQGWGKDNVFPKLKNSGSENVTSVKLKVVDAVVFDFMRYCADAACTWIPVCLNVFPSGASYIWNRDDGNRNFPAGTEKTVCLYEVEIKDAAPVEVHNISTFFQYAVY